MKLNPIKLIAVISLIACSAGCTSLPHREKIKAPSSKLSASAILSNQKQCAISGEDYGLAVQFATQIQLAVQNGDATAFAHLGHYPVRLNQGRHYSMIDSSTLEATYDQVITPKMQAAILAQDPNDIFCNDQGAFIANGDLWFHANATESGFFVINSSE